MILADITAAPDAQSLLQFMLIVGMLVTIASSISVMINSRRVQKREVSFSTEFSTKEEVAALADRIERLESGVESIRDEMKQDRNTILAAGEHRAEKIHERINDVMRAVSRLDGKTSNR